MKEIHFQIYMNYADKWVLSADWFDHEDEPHYRMIGSYDTQPEAWGVYLFWLHNNSPEDLVDYQSPMC